MSLPGVERVIGEVVDVLAGGLATKLAELAAEYDDGIAPPAPAENAIWRYLPRPIPDYPAIVVQAMPEQHEAPSVGGEYTCRYQIQIDVIARAGEPGETDVHLWRYWRAIKELLCAPGALDCGACVVESVDHSAPVVTDPGSGDELRDVPGLFVVTTHEIA